MDKHQQRLQRRRENQLTRFLHRGGRRNNKISTSKNITNKNVISQKVKKNILI